MLSFRTATRTHVGKVRKLNEDSLLARGDIGLWAVADGMGGHDAGDFASRMVVEHLALVPPPADGRGFLTAVQDALTRVNTLLWDRAGAQENGRVIGSTVAAVLSFDGAYACIWAGDSRIYLSRAGRMQQLTRDHSLVQQMVDAGALSEEEARTHPDGNVITRAVGAGASLQLDVVSDSLQAGDKLLLCSDGLTKMLDDPEIAQALEREDIQKIADDLLEQSLERGGKDNVSIVIVQMVDATTHVDDEDDTMKTTAGLYQSL